MFLAAGGPPSGPSAEDQRESRRKLNILRPLIEGWLSMAAEALERGESHRYACGELQLIGGKTEVGGGGLSEQPLHDGVMAALRVSTMDHYARQALGVLSQTLSAFWRLLQSRREALEPPRAGGGTHAAEAQDTQDSELTDDGLEALLAGIPLDGAPLEGHGVAPPGDCPATVAGAATSVLDGAVGPVPPLSATARRKLDMRGADAGRRFVVLLYDDLSSWLSSFSRGRAPRDHKHRLSTSLFLPAVDCLALAASILASEKVRGGRRPLA